MTARTPRTVAEYRNRPGTIYLLHFETPYKHAQHYLGWTQNVEQRLDTHARGGGAKLTRACLEAQIAWTLVRTWEDKTLYDERRMHRRKNNPRYCPICTEGVDPAWIHHEEPISSKPSSSAS